MLHKNVCYDRDSTSVKSCFYLSDLVLLDVRGVTQTLHLFISLQEAHHERQVSSFLQDHGSLYQDVKSVGPEEELDRVESRNLGM